MSVVYVLTFLDNSTFHVYGYNSIFLYYSSLVATTFPVKIY